ncbi:non-ribosomal peptide synthetase [Aldersonia kunmingensis]|uniref:non-ribosomal peptide synthetase n=1 Tax=Aldersonia kunmingensis TaxID=408066 RepID=UPI0009FEB42C|nr:non-ribosomal peptide synthetase [Aldersonia kunmingensis]
MGDSAGQSPAAGRPRRRPSRSRGPRVITLPELLSLAAERAPDAEAVTLDGRSLTYAELDKRSSQLARWLIELGVGPEQKVALAFPRSMESVLSVWAVAKSGAAFVPVDPNYPAGRVEHMLTDSVVTLGITSAAYRDELPGTVRWLVLDDPANGDVVGGFSAEPVTFADRVAPLRGDHPAYIIYTSGSTGLPKGVVVTHGGLAPFAAEQVDRYGLSSASRTLHFASPSFDASVMELLLAVGASATMVIAPLSVYGGPELAALLDRERVSHVFITPAALATVDPNEVHALEVIAVGGEAYSPELMRRWADKVEFHNVYGPTETTIVTHISDPLVPGGPMDIGSGIRGVATQVLDPRLKPAPGGVAGEMYLSGPGLARGYHARPSLTATRFVADPFGAPGARVYRTGDVVRVNAAGNVEYVGRNDFQVKIRGYRIELGEIDAILGGHPDVEFAVTIGRETPTGEQILVSYVVIRDGGPLDHDGLLQYVGKSVPGYMVPTTVVQIDGIPLTPVGKLDRAALPVPELEHAEFVAPADDLERLIADVFADILQIERIGAHDDFFELGGNSLMATKVTARLSTDLGYRVAARELFEASTVAGLAARVRIPGESEEKSKEIVAVARPDNVPLSYAQQRMWFLSQFEATSAVYNVPLVVRLSGPLDGAAMSAAFVDVLARHESLRTRYPVVGETPVQDILDPASVPVDLNPIAIDPSEIHSRVIDLIADGFDLTVAAPVRAALYEIAPDDHVLAVVIHHIACDGSSMAPLARDVMTAYLARSQGNSPGWAPLQVQYADVTLWQRERLGDAGDSSSLAGRQLAFWRTALDGAPEVLNLPSDRPRPTVQSYAGGEVEFTVPADLEKRLEEISRQHNSTVFMVVHAALALLLTRLSANADVTIGTPIHGRGDAVLDDQIGLYVNTLVLRTIVDPSTTFAELLDKVRSTDIAAFDNADLPFESLVEQLSPARSTAYSPLFQTLLVFQNFAPSTFELPGLTVNSVEFDTQLAKFDLQLTLSSLIGPDGKSAGMAGSLIYATDLFDRDTISGFAERFLRILDAIATDPGRRLDRIEILADAERAQVLVERNATEQAIDTRTTLVSLYDQQVVRTPDATAVIFGEQSLTYREFDERVNRLARHLIDRGVGPEVVVAVAMHRSIELVVAVHAVLKAGGVYVPLDPDLPAERQGYIVESARPVCVLVSEPLALPLEVEAVDVPRLDLDRYSAEAVTDADRIIGLRPHNTAYLIYTSGSTGRPKGVALPHSATVNQLLWAQAEYPLGATDVVLHKTPITFDISVWEMLWTLQAGATLVVAAPGGHRDPQYIADVIAEYSVTTMHFVPSVLAQYLATVPVFGTSVRRVFAAGEALHVDTVERFRLRSGAELHNWYGPAEVEVVTAWDTADVGDSAYAVPIGVPAWNMRTYVLDSRLRIVPPGVPGELYVAGPQAARGYYGRPELTAERFVASPFGAGQRLYRTGDLVRWSGKSLEYLGRTDFQVKIRGQRIELGEIESALVRLDGVSEAIVLLRSDERLGDHLVGYVASRSGVHSTQVRGALAESLPSYMVPSAVVVLDEFPLTPNGKIDRRALPEPVMEARTFRAPVTPIEAIVAQTFADVLGVSGVGLDDDFFDLGGNSLIATRVAARLGAALEAQVPVRVVFEAATVEALAVRVERHVGTGGRARLVAGRRPERIPLSLAQQRMWFLNRLDPTSAVNNIPVAVRLSGALNVAALSAAIGDVIERHEVLRTVYPHAGGDGMQVIVPAAQAFSGLQAEPVDDVGLEQRLAELVGTGFDVTAAVPLKAGLFELAPDEHVLVVVVHHISADGVSMTPLTRDLVVAYEARSRGAEPTWSPLPVQYADFAMWQREVLGSEDDLESLISSQLAYWQGQLVGIPDQLDLPTDRARPAVASNRGASLSVTTGAELHRGITELAQRTGSSPFMVVHTALAVLLARLSGSSDIVIGTPVAGRGDAELDNLVGMFVNTLVLRTEVGAAESFASLLRQARETDLQAFGHAELPFERLVEVLNPDRSQARHPVFQVMLAFQNLGRTELELPGLAVSAVEFDTALSKFDMQVTVAEQDPADGLAVIWTYAADLFDAATVQTFADRLVRVLAAAVADPAVIVGDIELLDAHERTLLTERWGTGTELPLDDDATLLSAFAAQVAARPDAIAVVAGSERLTYREFEARVNRLARELIAHGVQPEARVALGMRRSLDLLVAMYAVLEAGGAYVPLDPDHPVDRLAYVLQTARPVLVLTSSTDGGGTVINDAAASAGVTTLLDVAVADLSARSAASVTDADRIASLRPDNTAYIIFTSGSTGRPKGVAVEHRSVVNQIRWITDEYRIDANDVVLQKTPTTFDVSVWELFGALAVGARLVIAAPDGHRDPDYLVQVIAGERVTLTSFVPSMLSIFAADAAPGQLDSLRAVLIAGEALAGEVVAGLRRVTSADAFNLYGPTEFTVHATHAPVGVDSVGAVPIGIPVANSQVHVLDSRLHPVPSGVAGELYLAGTQLARGYFDRPELSAERFVADPFGSGDRLYRTGDLVRWTASSGHPGASAPGSLEYLGRTDFQVKVRGLRIELGEIESVLLAQDSVARAVVIVREDPRMGGQLIGYVVPRPGARPDVEQLRDAVRAELPSYMLPSMLVVLDEFPVNPSGKLDRKALPEPVIEARSYRAPSTPVEEIVAETFADVLGVDRVGIDDDFFELGGNSLIATRLVARLGVALNAVVPVRVVFEASSVAGLAVRVERHVGSGGRVPLVARQRPERVPLSLAQQRMWFLNRLDPSSAVNNIPVAVRLSGQLDVAALSAAIGDVIERHEVLRTIYPDIDGVGVQRVVPLSQAVPVLSAVDVAVADVIDRVAGVVSLGFDVTERVPFRVGLFRITREEHVLVVVVHHISGDGFSILPLTRDLVAAYEARSRDVEPGWPPLPVQYADFALWQREVLGSESEPESLISGQLTFWTNQLADLPTQLELPSDRPRPLVASNRGAYVTAAVDAETHRGIVELARATGSTPFMVVHAALAVLLARLSGTNDIVVGTPVAGRGERELDDLVGMFVNTLVLRTPVRAEMSFGEVLSRVRETDLAAFAHADVPFERMVEVLNPPRSQSHHPLFQVMLSFQNFQAGALELPGLSIAGVEADLGLVKFDLDVTVTELPSEDATPAGLTLHVGYATDLFDAATVADYLDRFVRLTQAVVAYPTAVIGDVELLDVEERSALLARSVTPAIGTGDTTLVRLFEAAAQQYSDRPAVRFDGGTMTYRELDERSNRIATELVTGGVGPESVVAVAVSRSATTVPVILAVLKAGGAYLPLDIELPMERLAYIIDEADPIRVVTTLADRERLPANNVAEIVLDDLHGGATALADVRVRPNNTAYVIYTPGSTGTPKGVAVTHRNVAELLANSAPRFGFDQHDVWTMLHSSAFDFSVWEMWGALAFGGLVVVVDYPTSRSPEDFLALVAGEAVTVVNQTPSAFYQFVENASTLPELALRYVILGGEPLNLRRLDRWFELAATAPASAVAPERYVQLVNVYGITETTVHSTFVDIDREFAARATGSVIGSALPGVSTYVLDERLRPVPVGVPGEIYVAGEQVSAGYRGRTGLRTIRFVADPFGPPGTRMYRTGDVARWNREGQLEYVGRSDQQVQLRGVRIELEQIEAVLEQQPGVAQAIAAVVGDERSAHRLVGYVVPEAGAEPDPVALRTAVGEFLAIYMVPDAIVVMDSLPLTSTGEVDRGALPPPKLAGEKSFREPRTRIEQVVAAAYAEFLGTERVGLDDSFFDLGGNSLLAMQVISRVRKETGAEVRVQWMISDSSVSALAAQIERVASGEADTAEDGLGVRITLSAKGSQSPLFCIHPMIGISWGYSGLTSELVDRPVYGLQNPAISEPGFAASSVADLARRYVAEIRQVQPNGPYTILGYSLGGLIAFEVAVALQADGAEVADLIMMDTAMEVDPGEFETELAVALRTHLGVELSAEEEITRLSRERFEEIANNASGDFLTLGADQVERLLNAVLATPALMNTFEPKPYSGDLIYFSALDHPRPEDAALLWQPYVEGRISNFWVEFDHGVLMAPEPLGIIGRVLERELGRFDPAKER